MEDIVVAPDAVVAEQPFTQALRAAHGRGNRLGHVEGEKEVVCQNCGGHTTFFGTLTSTRCPYCATPIQRTDIHEAPDRLAVDGVLPFQVDEAAAEELMKKWVNKRWFAPNEFKKYSTAGSFASVYTAYFTFDAAASTEYRGERGKVRTRTRNGKTTTHVSWRPVAGRVENYFDDVSVIGNTGLQSKHVAKLEPWPTQRVQPFSPDYMAGHLAKTYDKDIETCFGEASVIMGQEIDRTIKRDIGGDRQRIHHKRSSFYNKTYKHVLLPIWLLTVLYNGEPWQVFINGATGEVHGERPYSKVKIAAAVIAVLIVVVIVLVLNQQQGG